MLAKKESVRTERKFVIELFVALKEDGSKKSEQVERSESDDPGKWSKVSLLLFEQTCKLTWIEVKSKCAEENEDRKWSNEKVNERQGKWAKWVGKILSEVWAEQDSP